MFEPLPVRRGEFRRNIKKQFNKLLRGMQAYALISLGVRITVTNTKAKGGKQTHIGTQVGSVMLPPTVVACRSANHGSANPNANSVLRVKLLASFIAVSMYAYVCCRYAESR